MQKLSVLLETEGQGSPQALEEEHAITPRYLGFLGRSVGKGTRRKNQIR
jgi:hypothetical protein